MLDKAVGGMILENPSFSLTGAVRVLGWFRPWPRGSFRPGELGCGMGFCFQRVQRREAGRFVRPNGNAMGYELTRAHQFARGCPQLFRQGMWREPADSRRGGSGCQPRRRQFRNSGWHLPVLARGVGLSVKVQLCHGQHGKWLAHRATPFVAVTAQAIAAGLIAERRLATVAWLMGQQHERIVIPECP